MNEENMDLVCDYGRTDFSSGIGLRDGSGTSVSNHRTHYTAASVYDHSHRPNRWSNSSCQ